MRVTKIIVIIAILGLIVPLNAVAQKKAVYKHPKKNFQFEAGENWKNVKHSEDDLIYEMIDPEKCIHVMLWFTETMNSAKNYLNKMADMKGFNWENEPKEMAINDREAWLIDCEGTVNNEKVKVLLVSIPITDEKYAANKDHIAQYIIQIWCPLGKYDQKRQEMDEILQSVIVK